VEEVEEVVGSYYGYIEVRLGSMVPEARLMSLVLGQSVRGVGHE
jgi:hypothetical protein